MVLDDLPCAFVAQLPIDSQVPFSDQSGVISGVVKDIRERLSVRRDQCAGQVRQISARSQAGAPHIPTGQQAVAGGDAVGSCGMRVGEYQAFSRQPVKVGRRDFATFVENPDIAVSHVISEDDHDVWRNCLIRRR